MLTSKDMQGDWRTVYARITQEAIAFLSKQPIGKLFSSAELLAETCGSFDAKDKRRFYKGLFTSAEYGLVIFHSRGPATLGSFGKPVRPFIWHNNPGEE